MPLLGAVRAWLAHVSGGLEGQEAEDDEQVREVDEHTANNWHDEEGQRGRLVLRHDGVHVGHAVRGGAQAESCGGINNVAHTP